MADVYVTCSRCKAKAPMKGMRYNTEGNDLICQKCYGKEHGSSLLEGTKQKDELLNRSIPAHYICTSCGYKFQRDINYRYWQKCPWCEKMSVRKDTAKPAAEIIKEAQAGEKMWKY